MLYVQVIARELVSNMSMTKRSLFKVLENHPNDSRVKVRDDDIFQTLNGRMGTGGAIHP